MILKLKSNILLLSIAVEEHSVLLSSRLEKLSGDLRPLFLLQENMTRTSVCFLLHNTRQCESQKEVYLQHPITLPFKQAAVTGMVKQS